MRTAIVDTGAWIALRNRDDRFHGEARRYYDQLDADGVALLTTNYIVDETATRLRYDLGLDTALVFRDVISTAERAKRLRLVWIDRRIETEAWAVLERYAGVPLSMTDAVTVAVARARRIHEVFGFDDDFRAVGLAVAPAP